MTTFNNKQALYLRWRAKHIPNRVIVYPPIGAVITLENDAAAGVTLEQLNAWYYDEHVDVIVLHAPCGPGRAKFSMKQLLRGSSATDWQQAICFQPYAALPPLEGVGIMQEPCMEVQR